MEHLGSWSTVGALEKLHMWQNEALPITSSFVGPSPRDGLPMAVVAVDWRDRPDVAEISRGLVCWCGRHNSVVMHRCWCVLRHGLCEHHAPDRRRYTRPGQSHPPPVVRN